MATYVMLGNYSQDSVVNISAVRTDQALELLKEYGGKLKSGFALLGENDLLLIVEFRNNEQAMKASVALSKLLGVSFSTAPAMEFDDFDKLIENL